MVRVPGLKSSGFDCCVARPEGGGPTEGQAGERGVMTEQEAFAAGWHASREGFSNEDLWVQGPDGPMKETHTYLRSDTPVEILEDEQLLAAWTRGYDEGIQAQFDEAYPPGQKPE